MVLGSGYLKLPANRLIQCRMLHSQRNRNRSKKRKSCLSARSLNGYVDSTLILALNQCLSSSAYPSLPLQTHLQIWRVILWESFGAALQILLAACILTTHRQGDNWRMITYNRRPRFNLYKLTLQIFLPRGLPQGY